MADENAAWRGDRPAVERGRIGFFGKVPTHGDFVSAGLNKAFHQGFDQWLQQALRKSQRQMEGDWLRAYRQAPTWRFVLEQGVCGPFAVAGVLMPNVDRVGRYFPLVLAGQLAGFGDNAKGIAADEAWFAAAEALVETSLYRDFNLVSFAADIGRLRLPSANFAADVGRLRLPLASGKPPEAAERKPGGSATTIWWTKGSNTAVPSGFITVGMPDPADFKRLLAPSRPEPARPATADDRPLTQPEPARLRTPITLRSARSTHAGTRAIFNSDAVFVSEHPHIYAVADGVGVGREGSAAARLVAHALSVIPDQLSLNDLFLETKGKLGRAHGILKSAPGYEDSAGPSASVVALVSAGDQCAILSAGDARCYLLRDGLMTCLTRDHVEIGINLRLTNGVGGGLNFVPDMVIETLAHGDRFLLCSAPLPRVLGDRAIAEILVSHDVENAAAALIQDCLISDVKENVSAIVIGASAQ